ncbi:unnamed protein product [Adineta ricciae]|uniref:Uncharacterized protein n=1 Tax=Adineta ricciae TaxID=249248 RepID=A0A816ASC5_ADIRI|nr:unnamed protein product [Adineta ricciae]
MRNVKPRRPNCLKVHDLVVSFAPIVKEMISSNNPARKRPVPWYSGDFMEAVFPMSGFIWFGPEPTGTYQNRDFLGNSWNPALGIIVLGGDN